MRQERKQMSLFDPDMPCGRMSSDASRATKETTSGLSSKSSVKSKTRKPLFLDLRGVDGLQADVSWEMGIPSLGEYSTQDFGESPSVVEESGLSQILEAHVHPKYFLSERACHGVLRRAEKRGKKLPDILETALIQQIDRWKRHGSPLPKVDDKVCCASAEGFGGYNSSTTGEQSATLGVNCGMSTGRNGVIECYDARGNGEGNIVPTITGNHNDRITDYTAVVCEEYVANSSGEDIATTIDAHYYLGCGARGGKEREFVALEVEEPEQVHQNCYALRRFTPLECMRLQGMPDWWLDGVEGSETAKYKLAGNGMALPNVLYILEGI